MCCSYLWDGQRVLKAIVRTQLFKSALWCIIYQHFTLPQMVFSMWERNSCIYSMVDFFIAFRSVSFSLQGNSRNSHTGKCITTCGSSMPCFIFPSAPNEGEYDNVKNISHLVNIWKRILQESLHVKSKRVFWFSNHSVNHSMQKNPFWGRLHYA